MARQGSRSPIGLFDTSQTVAVLPIAQLTAHKQDTTLIYSTINLPQALQPACRMSVAESKSTKGIVAAPYPTHSRDRELFPVDTMRLVDIYITQTQIPGDLE
jgi:Tfp pilus assembly protein PilP